ncbi:MAG: hypothetical protein A2Y40_05140 [Candidatus Margulisbacteria bacterium GWF2_35_9]|nr:MAG: hypothetical protein A2Y40_05140 [Candidatus Margulisbacteria bacterium GWF2_35_9]
MANNTLNKELISSNSYEDDEIDILALIQTLFKHIKLIIFIIVSVTILTALYSLTIKAEFKASTRFFIPESSSAPSYMSTINSLGFGSLLGGGGNTSLEIVTNVLSSRRMAKDIITKFQLGKYYAGKNTNESAEIGLDTMESLIGIVSARLSVQKDKSNFITLAYEDYNPELAANIANYAVENLDNINEKLGITSQKPLVIVLDKAEKPTQRSKPSRKNMVVVGFIASSLLGAFLAFAIEYLQNLLSSKNKA